MIVFYQNRKPRMRSVGIAEITLLISIWVLYITGTNWLESSCKSCCAFSWKVKKWSCKTELVPVNNDKLNFLSQLLCTAWNNILLLTRFLSKVSTLPMVNQICRPSSPGWVPPSRSSTLTHLWFTTVSLKKPNSNAQFIAFCKTQQFHIYDKIESVSLITFLKQLFFFFLQSYTLFFIQQKLARKQPPCFYNRLMNFMRRYGR